MTRFLQSVSVLCFTLMFARAVAKAQDTPAGISASSVGFHLPDLGGSLVYSATASQSITGGFYGSGASSSTNFSGNLAFLSKSEKHPFSLVYSGGVLVANAQQPTAFFQSVSLSQVLSMRHWTIVVVDSPSYLPESPTAGFSGIPGVGDLGVDPITAGPSAESGILTAYGPRVANTSSGTVSRALTRGLSVEGSASYSLLRFLGDTSTYAVNSSSESGSVGGSYRLDARDNFNAGYNLSRSTYSSAPAVISQGLSLGYSRQWSRRISTSISGGPERISSSGPFVSGPSTQFSAGVSASYLGKRFSSSLSYSRGTTSGSGVIAGAFSDSIGASLHRQVARRWDFSSSVNYNHSSALPIFNVATFSSQNVSLSAQVSRGFHRQFSGFASYSLSKQLVQDTIGAQNAFNGVYQTLGFGVSYSPRTFSFGR